MPTSTRAVGVQGRSSGADCLYVAVDPPYQFAGQSRTNWASSPSGSPGEGVASVSSIGGLEEASISAKGSSPKARAASRPSVASPVRRLRQGP